jgi:predicted transcriptional regulator
MTKKRSRLEIYIETLKWIRSGINKPTNIMYKSNLSWIPLKNILDFLVKQDLI